MTHDDHGKPGMLSLHGLLQPVKVSYQYGSRILLAKITEIIARSRTPAVAKMIQTRKDDPL